MQWWEDVVRVEANKQERRQRVGSRRGEARVGRRLLSGGGSGSGGGCGGRLACVLVGGWGDGGEAVEREDVARGEEKK